MTLWSLCCLKLKVNVNASYKWFSHLEFGKWSPYHDIMNVKLLTIRSTRQQFFLHASNLLPFAHQTFRTVAACWSRFFVALIDYLLNHDPWSMMIASSRFLMNKIKCGFYYHYSSLQTGMQTAEWTRRWRARSRSRSQLRGVCARPAPGSLKSARWAPGSRARRPQTPRWRRRPGRAPPPPRKGSIFWRKITRKKNRAGSVLSVCTFLRDIRKTDQRWRSKSISEKRRRE